MAEAPANRIRPMSPEEIRQSDAAMQADILAEVQDRDITNGPAGGRYKVGDDYVDSDGKPVKAKKD